MSNETISTKQDIAPVTRLAGLDELRGFCILWVMWAHGAGLWTWVPKEFGGFGYHGVVLFFIISGYLITRILLDGKGRANFFSHYYINRIFRIWPLMLVALAVSALFWPQNAYLGIFNLLMINNYAHAYGINEMVRTDVMWSLAIEWQFYMIWPVVVYFLDRKKLSWTASAIIFIGLCFDADIFQGIKSPMATHSAMQYIAMGTLIAISGKDTKYFIVALSAFLLLYFINPVYITAAGSALCLIEIKFRSLADFRFAWYGITFVLVALVYYTVNWKPLITWKPLAEIGKRCYGLYLIHFFISWAVLEYFGKGDVWQGVGYFVVSTILAYFSFRYFEQPALDMRKHFYASDKLRILLFSGYGLMVVVCTIMLIPTMKSPLLTAVINN